MGSFLPVDELGAGRDGVELGGLAGLAERAAGLADRAAGLADRTAGFMVAEPKADPPP